MTSLLTDAQHSARYKTCISSTVLILSEQHLQPVSAGQHMFERADMATVTRDNQ